MLHILLQLHMDCFGYRVADIPSSSQMVGSHKLLLLGIRRWSDIQLLYMLREDYLVIQEDSSIRLYVLQLYILLYHRIEHLYMDLYILCLRMLCHKDNHCQSGIRIGNIVREDFLPSLVGSGKQLYGNWFHTMLLCHKAQM